MCASGRLWPLLPDSVLPASELHHSSSAIFLGAGLDKDLFSCLSFKGLRVTCVPKTVRFPLAFKACSLFIYLFIFSPSHCIVKSNV